MARSNSTPACTCPADSWPFPWLVADGYRRLDPECPVHGDKREGKAGRKARGAKGAMGAMGKMGAKPKGKIGMKRRSK